MPPKNKTPFSQLTQLQKDAMFQKSRNPPKKKRGPPKKPKPRVAKVIRSTGRVMQPNIAQNAGKQLAQFRWGVSKSQYNARQRAADKKTAAAQAKQRARDRAHMAKSKKQDEAARRKKQAVQIKKLPTIRKKVPGRPKPQPLRRPSTRAKKRTKTYDPFS